MRTEDSAHLTHNVQLYFLSQFRKNIIVENNLPYMPGVMLYDEGVCTRGVLKKFPAIGCVITNREQRRESPSTSSSFPFL